TFTQYIYAHKSLAIYWFKMILATSVYYTVIQYTCCHLVKLATNPKRYVKLQTILQTFQLENK
ncbi:hypothetical protein BUZ08_13810, partial [Staphylococcus gallinarum]|uniref:hypothetical protein n=1 Tax=Staphylococcus gallinarum TaxID=1293 RepID=UPI000D3F4BBF